MDEVELKKTLYFQLRVLLYLFILIILFIMFLSISQDTQATDVEGYINQDTVWDISGSPYIVKDDIQLSYDYNLTIEPGVEVRFDGYHQFKVKGELFVNGNETHKVIFRSHKNSTNDSDWPGLDIDTFNSFSMKNCTILNGRTAIDIRPSNFLIENTTIRYSEKAIYMNYNNDNIIKSVLIENCLNGIEIFKSHENSLLGVQFKNISFDVMIINRLGQANKIYYNHTIKSCAINGKTILYFFEKDNITIEYPGVGMIIVAWGDNVTLKNCDVSDGGGIIFYNTKNSKVINCNVSDNYVGFGLYQSEGFPDNEYWIGNTIENNTISNNARGIKIEGSTHNLIIDNKILSNDMGFYFTSPVRNIIYHNNFIDNNFTVRVSYFPSSIKNVWNNETQGNYWDDHDEEDLGGDGIIDTPFNVIRNSYDYFPLGNPWNGSLPPDTTPPYFLETPFIDDRILTIPRDWLHLVIEASEDGFYEVIIDTDGIEGFDNSTDTQLTGEITSRRSNIFWNGTNRKGKLVDDGIYILQIWISDDHSNRIAEPHNAQLIQIQKDSDEDGVLDNDDALPYDPNESSDYDHDGIGDNSDNDLDNDGWENNEDEFPWDKNEWKDTDGDGKGDNEDPDDNANGIPDLLEIPLVIFIIIIPILTIYTLNRHTLRKKEKKKQEEDPKELNED
jgi:parallel beta-helix repeat protein